MKILIKIGLGVVLIVALVFLFLNMANFSSGYRAGVPIKVSHKGVLFKTWEGQLNVGGLTSTGQGAIPTTWEFSIPDDLAGVRDQIEEAITAGKRVKLSYLHANVGLSHVIILFKLITHHTCNEISKEPSKQ